MTFDIRQHIEFDAKGRAQCPSCPQEKGGKALSVQKTGAYKCWRGCSSEDIRAAIGQPKTRANVAPPPEKKTSLTLRQVQTANEALLKSKNALPWLLERGIGREAIEFYKLGAVRSGSQAKGWKGAISIPIPAANVITDGYAQKKRIAPWDSEYSGPAWSQHGLSATVYSTHEPEEPGEIWLCEGEWDAIRLGWAVKNSPMDKDIHVACFTCGAGNIPPANEIDRLPNVPIVTFYDLDEPGTKGAAKLQQRFKDRVRIAMVPASQERDDGWDISDALANGFGLDDVLAAAAAAAEWAEPKRENPLRDRLVTNLELMNRAADFQEFLIPDLLPADELIVLAGPPREGKGFAALGMAIGVAAGSKFLDRRCTQGTVLYVNLEDSETKIKQRQLRMQRDWDLPIIWLDKFKLSELPYLIEIADEIPDLRLIVIDTLARARDDNNEEGSAKLSQILEPLQEYPKKSGVCIVLVHHAGKIGDTAERLDPFDLIRGSSAIRGTARGAILLIPGKDGHRMLVENGHSESLDMLIRRDPATVEWRLMGNWAPVVDMGMKDRILDHLTRNGQGTVSEISHALSFNAASVGTILSRLYSDDLVSKVAGRGRRPAIYSRSFNLLQRSTGGVEACDLDREKNTALLQQVSPCEENPEKVINGEKSDQCVDHFPENALTHTLPLKQSQEPDGASDVCFNGGSEVLKQTEATPTRSEGDLNTPSALPAIGASIRYVGEHWQTQKALGRKHMTVTQTNQNDEGWWVTVEHPAIAVSQTLKLCDVKVIKS